MPALASLPRDGLGGAGLGNLYRAVSDETATETVHEALRAGLGLVDTAPYYGHGLSEMRVGAALKAWSGRRPLISSKVGRVLDPAAPGAEGDFGFVDPAPFRPRFDYSGAGVRQSLQGSFARLGLERLDVALIHDIGRQVHGEAHPAVLREVFEETLPSLNAARGEGLVDRIGLGVNEWEVCAELMDAGARLDCILLAGRYTLLEQGALGFLNRCADEGVAVLAAGVFNSGLLATPPGAESTYNYAAAPAEVVARARRLWDVCGAFGIAPQAAAIQFVRAHPAVQTILVGMRSPQEAADFARWNEAVIAPALWPALKRDGLIAADAPVPNEE